MRRPTLAGLNGSSPAVTIFKGAGSWWLQDGATEAYGDRMDHGPIAKATAVQEKCKILVDFVGGHSIASEYSGVSGGPLPA